MNIEKIKKLCGRLKKAVAATTGGAYKCIPYKEHPGIVLKPYEDTTPAGSDMLVMQAFGMENQLPHLEPCVIDNNQAFLLYNKDLSSYSE